MLRMALAGLSYSRVVHCSVRVPIPLLMLHTVEAVLQAYLFGMLALIYIAGGIQSQEIRRQKGKEEPRL
jgi:F0F1-type ATP synthase membrane subunit a